MKKILALLLCAVLLVGTFTGCSEEGHKHCACGGKLEGHSCKDVTFTALTQKSFENVTAETSPVKLHNESVFSLKKGNYYLAEDIAVSEQVLIFEEVNLCLNGKRLAGTHSTRTGNYSRIFAVSGGTLNISDCCAETGQGNIQGSYVAQGGAILVQGSGGAANGDLGTVNLYSGIIKGGRATGSHGGTIAITGGTFRVWAGEITGGAAKQLGGNIYVAPGQTLELLGGSLGDGMANSGTCVYLSAEATAIVGGKAQAVEIYLAEGAKLEISQETPPVDGCSVPVVMQTPGVFAEGVMTDLSAFFPGSVYNDSARTLSAG